MISAKSILSVLRGMVEAKVPPVSPDVLKKVLTNLFEKLVTKFGSDSKIRFSSTIQRRDEYSGIDDEYGLDVTISNEYSAEDTEAFFDAVRDVIDRYGWYVTSIHPRGVWAPFMSLEPNYTSEMTHVPQFLYHFAPKNRVEDILRRGLIPQEGSEKHGFKYPPRVFLQFSGSGGYSAFGGIALKIDTSLLGRNVKFYRDMNMRAASVWTYAHIPPNAISLMGSEE
jgi:hypothetical protein